MKRIGLLMVALLWVVGAWSQRQRFVNLTAQEVEVADGVLPRLAYSFPLPENHRDSVYTVSLLYPEFVDAPKPLDSLLPAMPSVEQRIAYDRKKPSLEALFSPYVWREGRQQILVSFMLKLESRPAAVAARKAARSGEPARRYADHSVLASGRWAKIRVSTTGIHQLTESLIRQAGFTNLSKVKIFGYGGALQNEVLTEADLIRYDDLQEVPTAVVNGKRLFRAQGPVSWADKSSSRRTRNPYSDYGYYFLTQTDGDPLTVSADELLESFYPSADDYHTLYENDGYSWFHGGRNLYDRETIPLGSPKAVVLKNTSRSATGRLSVCVSSGTNAQAQILLNGQVLGTMRFSIPDQYTRGDEKSATYAISELHEQDTVKIVCTQGGPLRLDYVSMAWEQPAPAPDLANGTFPTPEYVHVITPQDLHGDGPADMVIIIPTSQKLRAQAERLKTFHETRDQLRVRIVTADELYNEFASGTPDANAYRRYMKMLYDRAETDADAPRYLLLFGDGVWDNRLRTPECANLHADDLLLCYESENSLHDVYCYVDDGFYGLLDDGEGGNPQSADKLDLGIGRFPVTTEADAKTMVDKTIAYIENKNAGSWQNTLVFMGDDGDNNRHMRDLNDAAEEVGSMYPGYVVKKIMWDAYDRESSSTGYRYPAVTRLIKQAQQNGALIMDYAGHGSEIQISHEAVLRIDDFANFTNQNLPLWITASCNLMPFDTVEETVGETAVLNKKGGAMAFFGTTRTVYAAQNKVINMAFLRHVLSFVDGKPITLGEAQRRTKNELIDRGTDLSTNKLQYSLLGDPALSLHLPQLQVVVDAINDIPTDGSQLPGLKAGSVATVKGHVEGAADFTGIVSATIRDSREQVVCKLNDTGAADTPFTYYDRTNIIYQGADSIVNGEFKLSFAVPMDINYSNATGLINLHAHNNAHDLDGHGHSEAFTVGGSDLASSDDIGPSIYCYLNSPSFVNGGRVNATPYFVAEVSDQDGINASGSGIGHDIELIVDGELTRTYTLNDYFQFDFGSYTKGRVAYSIPALEAGDHRLLFRVWDVLNNPSTTELSFRVEENLKPTIYDINCTQNPARTETTFVVTHDRLGSAIDVELQVFDMSGRQLWTHPDTGLTSEAPYTYTWDLTIDDGARLQTGVYLYRMRLTSDGSTHTSKAKKLIVL